MGFPLVVKFEEDNFTDILKDIVMAIVGSVFNRLNDHKAPLGIKARLKV